MNWGGAKLPPLDEAERQAGNLISGLSEPGVDCDGAVSMSRGTIELHGDSDAAIVKGLIAVVFILYHQMSAQDIVAFDVRPWFEKLALTQHLTPSRSQGLEAMIRAIRSKATQLA